MPSASEYRVYPSTILSNDLLRRRFPDKISHSLSMGTVGILISIRASDEDS